MSEIRTYHVITGSKAFFDETVMQVFAGYGEAIEDCDIKTFLQQVKLSDERKNNKDTFSDEDKAFLMILKNDNYHGIVESAHDRLGSLIEEVTHEQAIICLHNPPTVLLDYLKDQHLRELISMSEYKEKYNMVRKPEEFSRSMQAISRQIWGQNEAILQTSKSMWYLTSVNRKKPYVIMLFGGSSLGKTELVRQVAEEFYYRKALEKHLSMFKNDTYSYYFFGNHPNRRSLGFDLLERESNLIFLDEIDKCPEHFYSAFYTLFDNTIFNDATYEVDISGLLIMLTSNYSNMDEMKEKLGLPIFYRIDKFIHFEPFSEQTIYTITRNEINENIKAYGVQLDAEDIYSGVSKVIQTKGENARTIKNKVQSVIEDKLFEKVEQSNTY